MIEINSPIDIMESVADSTENLTIYHVNQLKLALNNFLGYVSCILVHVMILLKTCNRNII